MFQLLLLAGVILPGHAWLATFLMPHNGNNCTENQFSCISGNTCIEKGKRCNGVYDCKDMSDESDCGK